MSCAYLCLISAEISGSEWKGRAAHEADEIVGGAKYPTCIACHADGSPCLWEFAVIQARMLHQQQPKKECEACLLVGRACHFEWQENPLARLEHGLQRVVRHAAAEYKRTEKRSAENAVAISSLAKAVARGFRK